jgi:hypothetical protein
MIERETWLRAEKMKKWHNPWWEEKEGGQWKMSNKAL